LQERGISERHACVLAGCSRPTVQYQARKPSDEELAGQLRSLAADDKSRAHGYRKYAWLIRRDFKVVVNHKRIYRVYATLRLSQPKAGKKHLPAVRRSCPPAVGALNERWSVDFAKDRLMRGRQFRIFDVVEDCTSECMAIEAQFSLPSARVVGMFERLIQQRGAPTTIRFDNGPEFRSYNMERWADRHGITLHFIDPGKPMQNGKIESFHGRLRAEFLNHRWFGSLEEVQAAAEDWRYTYNHYRPHQSLKYETPARFASAHSLLAQLGAMLACRASLSTVSTESTAPTTITTSPQFEMA